MLARLFLLNSAVLLFEQSPNNDPHWQLVWEDTFDYFDTHDNKVKKNIIIGNGTCSNSLNTNDNVFLRASEGVEINGDFTMPVGAELYIDVNKPLLLDYYE